jgi:DNA-binding MarR family transcriptional regulator
MVREYRPELEELDLTYPQFLVMMSLWNKDAVYIKELTQQTYLDAATLTQVLKRLEKKGYIDRQKSEEDERAKVIVLTERGLALNGQASHILNGMECKLRLTKKEQLELTAICNKILGRLRSNR